MRVIGLVTTFVCAFSFALSAATPSSGTLNQPPAGMSSSTVAWTGGPYTGVTADPSLCTTLTCDTYALHINVSSTFYSSNPNYSVQVGLNWASTLNDYDLYVYDSSGNTVCSATLGPIGNSELADCGPLASGAYTVQVVTSSVVNSTYSGNAALSPEPTNLTGKARYRSGNFTWTNPLLLPGPQDAALNNQDLEPRVRTDALGNIYAAAIQGVPAGTDTWKSMDGGATWTYLGEPDGAQAASAEARGGGLGGGDEDLAIGNSGFVYVNSLWLGSATQSTSENGGNTWLVNPFSSDFPLVDRQWIASAGNNVVYLTTKQLGALLSGTVSVIANKSFDGGITWPQTTVVTTPEIGIQPGDQGNIEVDPLTGNVYAVFFDSNETTLYIARSTDGGQTFIVKQVYSSIGPTLNNVFPSLAIDRSGNLYIAFSDSHNVFLTSSTDQGATWSVPVRASSVTKSAIGPWITAGDSGKVDITWWGTSSTSNNDTTAQWKVYFAQSQNALAAIPTFSQVAATGIMHNGAICTNGTGCASGTRNLAEYFAPGLYLDGSEMIVYSDDYNNAAPLAIFIRQNGGAKVYSSK